MKAALRKGTAKRTSEPLPFPAAEFSLAAVGRNRPHNLFFPAMPCHDDADHDLRRSYEYWRDAAPPKPLSGQPTPEELDRLREFGTRRKEWLLSLEERERTQINVWDWEATRKRKEEARRQHAEAKKAAVNSIKKQRDASICRHWARTGTCLYGDACKFRHPEDNAITCNTNIKNLHRSRTRANRTNDNRMGAFRRFLLDTFGEQRLKYGSGVVEVAAGIHGGVSFELVNLNGIPCTAIEPRGPLRLTKRRRMLKNGIYHRTIPLQKYNSIGLEDVLVEGEGGDETGDDQLIIGKAPRHWRLFFCDWMIAPESEDINKRLVRSAKKAAALVGPAATASGHEEDYCAEHEEAGRESDSDTDDNESPATNADNPVFCQPCGIGEAQASPPATEVSSTLASASIIIGLHPDQPTGDIVDAALSMDKPFAVVPCCVFPKIFDQRTLPCETHVRSYEQFIEWIMLKNAMIRKKDLGFGGRSVVLYYDPGWEDGNVKKE